MSLPLFDLTPLPSRLYLSQTIIPLDDGTSALTKHLNASSTPSSNASTTPPSSSASQDDMTTRPVEDNGNGHSSPDLDRNPYVVEDTIADDTDDQTQTQTQTQTQGANAESQGRLQNGASSVWGMLSPVNHANPPFLFEGDRVLTKVGRNPTTNDLVLSGKRVSNHHATLTRAGSGGTVQPGRSVVVIVEDCSSNGTWVANRLLRKGERAPLLHRDQISFGPRASFGDTENNFTYTYYNMLDDKKSSDAAAGGGLYRQYDLREALGKGSFATVYKAYHRDTGEEVAVKVVPKFKFVKNPRTLKNLQREVDILQQLDHTNIVRYIDYFEDDAYIYIVIEYVDGGDLLDYILHKGGLDEAETITITRMLCQAVAFCHSKDIVHRDLKPENLLITRGLDPQVKVTDFGLAKAVSSMTWLKTMCGTPSYLAPEVVADTEETVYSLKVDSWSLGVIVFAMLCNTSPFEEDEEAPIRERILARNVDWEILNGRDVSDCGKDFISKLLTVDPCQRMSVTDALNHPWLAEFSESFSSSLSENTHSSSQQREQRRRTGFRLSVPRTYVLPGEELSVDHMMNHMTVRPANGVVVDAPIETDRHPSDATARQDGDAAPANGVERPLEASTGEDHRGTDGEEEFHSIVSGELSRLELGADGGEKERDEEGEKVASGEEEEERERAVEAEAIKVRAAAQQREKSVFEAVRERGKAAAGSSFHGSLSQPSRSPEGSLEIDRPPAAGNYHGSFSQPNGIPQGNLSKGSLSLDDDAEPIARRDFSSQHDGSFGLMGSLADHLHQPAALGAVAPGSWSDLGSWCDVAPDSQADDMDAEAMSIGSPSGAKKRKARPDSLADVGQEVDDEVPATPGAELEEEDASSTMATAAATPRSQSQTPTPTPTKAHGSGSTSTDSDDVHLSSPDGGDVETGSRKLRKLD